MKNNHMHFDTRKAKIYKDIYRPSPKISHFLGTLWSVILMGQSPVSNPDFYSRKLK